MTDLVLESFQALVLAGIVVLLWRSGHRQFEGGHDGWGFIVAGFGLLLIGSLLDITDNFEALNRFVVVGDTEVAAFLEKFVGFLGGFAVLAWGLYRWLPRVGPLSPGIGQRRRAEAALRESEGRYRDIVENVGDFIQNVDPDQKYTFVNKAWTRALGYDEEDLKTLTFSDVLHEDYLPHCREIFEGLGRGETFENVEAVFKAKDGREIAVEGHLSSVMDEGRMLRTLAIFRDVTERKQAEAALERAHEDLERRVEERTLELQRSNDRLRREEAKLREILENSPMGVAITTRSSDGVHIAGERLFVNSALVRMFGGSDRESFIKARIDDSWVDLDQLAAVEEKFKSGEDLVDFEVQRRRMNGATWWVSMNTRQIHFDGRDCTMVWHFDITERKRAEEVLRVSEMRLSGILDIAADAVISVDESQTIVMFNQSAQNIFGYSAEEALGSPLDMLLPERVQATHPSYVEGFDESLETTRLMMTERGEISGLRKDGAEFPAEASISRLDVGDRKIFTVTLRDISERKKAEAQLHQAQKMEAVGQLTGGIAHDFNNLLGIVLGNAELLSDRIGEDDPQIGALMRAANRGAELTQRLLAFSRRQPLRPKPIDVGALASGMVEMLRRSLGAAIDIKIASDRNLWTATADPGLLENALLNLAINARDAMSGTGTLVIGTGNASLDEAYVAGCDDVAPGDYVVLAVTDNGCGMPPEVLARVFEPFYTTKEVGKGTGLGLSMVYGFAKQSGGHIAIYSEVGKGTTVKLYLPRSDAAAVRAAPRVGEAPRGRGETVLVVEDDADIRRLASVLLGGLGYQVVEAHDGAAALEAFGRAGPIDLLLTDVVLPGGLSGPDLALEVGSRNSSLKIVFMSGYAADAVRLSGWLDNRAELLSKPFRKLDLARKIRAALDGTAD